MKVISNKCNVGEDLRHIDQRAEKADMDSLD